MARDLIKNHNQLERVVNELRASGITDEYELSETLQREHRYLFREPDELTESEKKEIVTEQMERLIEASIADLNRESIAKNGHPFMVSERVNGEHLHKQYTALTTEEIMDFKNRGLLL